MSQPQNIPQKENSDQLQQHDITTEPQQQARITEPQQHKTITEAQQQTNINQPQQDKPLDAIPTKEPTCYNCGHKGHKVPDCPVPRAQGRRLPFDPRRKVQKASRQMTVIKFNGGSHSHHTHYH